MKIAAVVVVVALGVGTALGQGFGLVVAGKAVPVVVEASAPETVKVVAQAFCGDVERVSGVRPELLATAAGGDVVLVGVVGRSAVIDRLGREGKLDVKGIAGRWEASVTAVVESPMPGVRRALVIAGSDRRGAAYGVFAVSRTIGVSPWSWWADVPVQHQAEVSVKAGTVVEMGPSVAYRGIFLNDEDWGLRPWAAKTMEPKLGNVGPRTYERVFELLLRLRGNSLWPAMHPGTAAFNADPENARLADRWGIVMGSSHSEALLRNNVGEWDEKRDGPWNFQKNAAAITAYWEKRLEENGKYENFYTVGMRGVHDGALEASGTREQKAELVGDVIKVQQGLLAKRVGPSAPQVVWVYKESLDLYRAGMKVPEDVTLGFTDDNYGYIRQLPTVEEQRRKGGAGIYYHVSYWGAPHDYLWLCTTPPALIREEMVKAYEHGARRYWVLNVGDLKPAEADMDYFLRLAWDEPGMAQVSQKEFLRQWYGEQFGSAQGGEMAEVMDRYYALNWVRKPEFMGFNGYNDGVQRTAFNPLAWGDQNAERDAAWGELVKQERAIGGKLSKESVAAFFELVGYPVEGAAAMNEKFLAADRTYLDAALGKSGAADAATSQAAYDRIQRLTSQYNGLLGGKWAGMMSDSPRERQVFKMPVLAGAEKAEAGKAELPKIWGAGTGEVVSLAAGKFSSKSDGKLAQWRVVEGIGMDGSVVVYGQPGELAEGKTAEKDAWVEYAFTTKTTGEAELEVDVLPNFAVDPDHGLRFGVVVDGRTMGELEAVNSPGAKKGAGGAATTWEQGVLQGFAAVKVGLGVVSAGAHTVRLKYVDPGVEVEHVVVRFAGSAPGYPVAGASR